MTLFRSGRPGLTNQMPGILEVRAEAFVRGLGSAVDGCISPQGCNNGRHSGYGSGTAEGYGCYQEPEQGFCFSLEEAFKLRYSSPLGSEAEYAQGVMDGRGNADGTGGLRRRYPLESDLVVNRR